MEIEIEIEIEKDIQIEIHILIYVLCVWYVYIYIHASQQFYSNGLGEKTWESRILGPRPAASSAALQDMLLLQAWPLRKSHADLKP